MFAHILINLVATAYTNYQNKVNNPRMPTKIETKICCFLCADTINSKASLVFLSSLLKTKRIAQSASSYLHLVLASQFIGYVGYFRNINKSICFVIFDTSNTGQVVNYLFHTFFNRMFTRVDHYLWRLRRLIR